MAMPNPIFAAVTQHLANLKLSLNLRCICARYSTRPSVFLTRPYFCSSDVFEKLITNVWTCVFLVAENSLRIKAKQPFLLLKISATSITRNIPLRERERERERLREREERDRRKDESPAHVVIQTYEHLIGWRLLYLCAATAARVTWAKKISLKKNLFFLILIGGKTFLLLTQLYYFILKMWFKLTMKLFSFLSS